MVMEMNEYCVDYLDLGGAPVLERIFDIHAPEEPRHDGIKEEPLKELEDISGKIEKLAKELSELWDIYEEECIDIPPFAESKKAQKCHKIERRMLEIYEELNELYL